MCRFKLFLQQTVLILASGVFLISCDIFLIGKKRQIPFGMSLLSSTKETQGACQQRGSTPESENRSRKAAAEEDNVLFDVEKITGNIGIDYNKKTHLPEIFRLRLKACIKDTLKLAASMPKIPFVIKYKTCENGDYKTCKKTVVKSIRDRGTDADGCLEWTEDFPHKYVIEPFWVNLWREIIIEKGPYAGKVTIPTAVNFWLDDTKTFQLEERVRDLRKQHHKNEDIFKKHRHPIVEKGIECLTDKKHESYIQLWAPNITIQFKQAADDEPEKSLKKSVETVPDGKPKETEEVSDEEKQSKNEDEEIEALIKKFQKPCKTDDYNEVCRYSTLNMELTIPLELKMNSIHGTLKFQDISGGNYKITAKLVAEYPTGRENYYRIHKQIPQRRNLYL